MPFIEVQGLGKCYRDHWVVRDFHLSVKPGEVIILQGPSGIGKTTLLRCMTGLEPFDEGSVQIDTTHVPPHTDEHTNRSLISALHRQVGVVFQFFHLFPHLTVLQNLTLGPTNVLGHAESQAQADARAWLKQVDLMEKAECYPNQLSGGQQQRVAIARALAMQPKIIFFDEPTSSLDPTRKKETIDVVSRFREQGLTMIIITHEPGFIERIASRVIALGSECRIESDRKI